MPKKTKKQKLRAQERHTSMAPNVSTGGDVISPTASFAFQFQATKQNVAPRQSENIQELVAIRGDLLRTIILAAAAIGLELYLYWRFFR